ncbi:MAG: PKD domain-containing protein [Candidatus Dojkabacteria bacterium]|nr:PKD domain-containing protein [Candidatus Dojkabacteria bacterium]
MTTSFDNYSQSCIGLNELVAEFIASSPFIRVGEQLTFTDKSIGDVSTWSWDFDEDGIEDSDVQNPSFNFVQAGSYDVILTVSDGLNTSDFAVTINVIEPNTTPQNVYRFLNNALGSAHFYVMGDSNKTTVENNSKAGGAWAGAFKYETVAFKAYEFNGVCPEGTVPVYRFLNNQFGSIHFYVLGAANKDIVVNNSKAGGKWAGAFSYETEAFCVYENSTSETVPVYRFRNDALGGSVHFYVVGTDNKNIVVSKSAPGGVWDGVFVYETIAFNALPADVQPASDTLNTYNSAVFNLGFDYAKDMSIEYVENMPVTCENFDNGDTFDTFYEEVQLKTSNTSTMALTIFDCIFGFGSGGGGEVPVIEESFQLTTKNGKLLDFQVMYFESNPDTKIISSTPFLEEKLFDNSTYSYYTTFNIHWSTINAFELADGKAMIKDIVESMNLDLV